MFTYLIPLSCACLLLGYWGRPKVERLSYGFRNRRHGGNGRRPVYVITKAAGVTGGQRTPETAITALISSYSPPGAAWAAKVPPIKHLPTSKVSELGWSIGGTATLGSSGAPEDTAGFKPIPPPGFCPPAA